jgi:hypothetical protein
MAPYGRKLFSLHHNPLLFDGDSVLHLLEFKEWLVDISLYNICFADLSFREFANVSELAFLYLYECELKDCSPKDFHMFLTKILEGISETIKTLEIRSKYNLPIQFPNSFQTINSLIVRIDLENFERCLQCIFESKSLRKTLKSLSIEIEIDSNRNQLPCFRFREKIMRNCSQKPMHQLKLFNIDILFKEEIENDIDELNIFKMDKDEDYDDSRSTVLFKMFIWIHFPRLRTHYIPDPIFYGKVYPIQSAYSNLIGTS